MSINTGSFVYGKQNINFSILYVDRKTMEIAVFPDASIVIKAPQQTIYEEIEKRVKKRARWICKQISYFRQFEPRTSPRQYLGGETHLYLGKQYRLKVKYGSNEEVKLQRGYFQVTTINKSNSDDTRKLLDDWYSEKAQVRFHECFQRCIDRFSRYSTNRPDLHIRRMKTRWGSLSKKGTLTLNVDLIRAPLECIEYVITHELCHLKYYDHSKKFYQLLEKVMPDWEKRKHKLEVVLA